MVHAIIGVGVKVRPVSCLRLTHSTDSLPAFQISFAAQLLLTASHFLSTLDLGSKVFCAPSTNRPPSRRTAAATRGSAEMVSTSCPLFAPEITVIKQSVATFLSPFILDLSSFLSFRVA